GRVHQTRLKPTPVPFDYLGRYVRMNDGRLEECGLELKHTRNFYLSNTPAVCRGARHHHGMSTFGPTLHRRRVLRWRRPRICIAVNSHELSLRRFSFFSNFSVMTPPKAADVDAARGRLA